MAPVDVRREAGQFGRREFLKGGAAVAAASLTGPMAFLHTKALAQGVRSYAAGMTSTTQKGT